jgi:hypothetical protein
MSDSIERAERYLAMRKAEIQRHIEVFGGYPTGGGWQPDDIIRDLLTELKTERSPGDGTPTPKYGEQETK